MFITSISSIAFTAIAFELSVFCIVVEINVIALQLSSYIYRYFASTMLPSIIIYSWGKYLRFIKLFTVQINYLSLIKIFVVNNNLPLIKLYAVNNKYLPLIIVIYH